MWSGWNLLTANFTKLNRIQIKKDATIAASMAELQIVLTAILMSFKNHGIRI